MAVEDTVAASDEISGVFRFLRDYRLTAPPGGDWSKEHDGEPEECRQYELYSDASSVATGTSGRGGPPLHHTPMGSTAKLIVEKNKNPSSSACNCLPSFGTYMVVLSLSASFANIVRLPTLVFLNGGGVFLLVYIAIAVVIGIPLVFLEVLLGQFCQEGPVKLWRAAPILKGVGFVKVLISVLTAVYYPVLMVAALYYALWSAKGPLPFNECKYLIYHQNGVEKTSLTNGETCLEQTFLRPPDQDPTWFALNIALLFFLWAIIVLCVSQGARSYRFCAFFLLATVIGCLVALLTEEIKVDTHGLSKLLQIDWNYLKNFDTWYFAMVQTFFSIHLGFGNLTTNAGRVFPKSSAFWTSIVYMVCNLAVGITFVCLVYMWIGRLESNGVTLVWPKIPEMFIINIMYDVATQSIYNSRQIWAVVMFTLVIFSGFISMVALVYTVVVSVMIETKERWAPWIITLGFCVIGFLAGIICLLPEKLDLVHMLDYYAVNRMVVTAVVLELIGFVWIYGSHALSTDFEFILGHKLNIMWIVIWFITPILLVAMEICSLVILPLNGPRQNPDPEWLYITGWIFYATAWIIILVVAIWQISTQVDYNVCQKFISSVKPSRNWGPIDTIQRHGWIVWREQCTLSGERDFTLKRRGTRDYTHSVRNAYNDPIGTRYYPSNVKNSQLDSEYPTDSLRTRIQLTERNYNSTQRTDASVLQPGPLFTVQMTQDTDFSDQLSWQNGERRHRTNS